MQSLVSAVLWAALQLLDKSCQMLHANILEPADVRLWGSMASNWFLADCDVPLQWLVPALLWQTLQLLDKSCQTLHESHAKRAAEASRLV